VATVSDLNLDQYPMQCHPAYAGWSESIRRTMDAVDQPYHITAPSFRRSAGVYDTIDERIFTVKKAWGLAPYVGPPFVYMWRVAVDDLGRSVSGESWIEYAPQMML
jgi:hypothetical protein